MDTIRLPPDFKEFLKSLNSKNVEYLVIGGYAVGYHGYPRATVDLDVWVAISTDNADRIVAALREFGFDVPGLSASLFLAQRQVVRMGVAPFRIEILTSISGVDFAECFANRIIDRIDGVDVNVIRREDLILNKQASGRPKDVNDVQKISPSTPLASPRAPLKRPKTASTKERGSAPNRSRRRGN